MVFIDVVQIISSLGFPVATAVGLFWFLVKELRTIRDNHNSEVTELRKVIENNTEALLRILEHIKEEEVDKNA